tara:strand:+ start:882 stop:1268 length:387 start_codon:yes stop_codon:yes gene_type:complete
MLLHYLFNINLNKKGKQLLLINLFFIIFFACLYYLDDFIISYYPEFSKKYLLKKDINENKKNEKFYTIKPYYYYLWFSIVTQTTVGYGGIDKVDGRSESFVNIKSIPYKIINIFQLLSILITPAIVLY